jgi:ATP-dependent helicase HrpB
VSALPPLPIDAVLPQLQAALTDHASAVLVAEPGAGKTTRVPLALLRAPWRVDGRILVLEPRRLAARAAATQMSRLLGEEVGQTVGYRVRLESRVSARTRIEVVTEGVFTRMILDDPSLDGIAAVLFDEFHERSLDADLGLALALDVQGALREELRLLVMSATLDAARVARLLGDAPVIVSEGRSFPVETRYAPREADRRVEDAVADAVVRALAAEPGSILAFLPGAGEIERTAERLRERVASDVLIAPLYGALDTAAQDRAVRPSPAGTRKVVLATSIAETSLTIEGVRVVVDGGLARVPRYEPGTGLTRLDTVRVSRAAADQRRGRAGRLEPGVCIRLWEEGQTRALPAFSTPEILEADLAPLMLDCAAFGVTDPATLAFLDPPPAPALAEARALLTGLEALDGAGRITAEGKTLARLPLAPRLAHMLHRAAERGQGGLAAEIAVLLGERGLGGNDIDLRHRVTGLRRDRSPRARDARRLAANWARLVRADLDDTDPSNVGPVLALAYPDRIGKARPGKPGEFVLANGRGAAVPPADALAREPFIVAADVTGSSERGRILLAAPLAEAELTAAFAGQIVETDEVAFDRAARAVRVRRVRRLGKLVLAEQPVPATGEAATAALMAGIADLGLDALPWSKAVRQRLDRARFLKAAAPDDWPALDDAHLVATLPDWLGPYVYGRPALADIGADDLAAALDALFGAKARQLEAEAPSHFEAPTGSRVPIDYDPERGPVIAIRVQELFGLDRHPSIAGGRMPLTLDLLSPAHRPIQTTRDLPGFWRGSWAEVRSAMRGRYPKHPWPDDPIAAPPTTRAKPRGT